ncbi:exosome catalytic subunit dis3 [Massospora cicadina]|nr:exosome catalytic subunit dis3 [Massospora cicadina]
MLRNRTFNRKNARGKVVKVVQEHYLRDDIYCSIPECTVCPIDKPALNAIRLGKLSTAVSPCPELVKDPHYLIPDTNVVVNQLDLLEHLDNVIILGTVHQESRNLSMNAAAKIKGWVSDPTRHFTSFANEHHRATHVERSIDESPNDRNDRAIRVAAKWYKDHMGAIPGTTVVLLTDDAENRKRATEMGLLAFSIKEYVRHLVAQPKLVDLIAEPINHREREQIQYEEHLSQLAMASGIEGGRLLQGTLNISHHNYLEGTIFAPIGDQEVEVGILGRKHLNRAIHGDRICVQLLPKEEWGSEAEVVVLTEEDEKLLGSDAKGRNEHCRPQGKVVGILKRNWRPYCGFIDKASVQGDTSGVGASRLVLFFPLDTRIPKIRIRTSQAGKLLTQRILVMVDQWSADSIYPMGHFVRALGEAGDKDTETEVLLLEHDVPHDSFSPQVLASLPAEGEAWVVRDEHLHGREDFRELDICSIDPPGCTDIDDALHARPLPNGNFEVGVHIADVTHFVQPGSAMDREAASRCTSVYLVNRRIDMLPGLLGTNLCSLRSDVDRLAFSCVWEMTSDAQIVNTRFTKSVIRSKASLTYEAAQLRLDDAALDDALTRGIRHLDRFASVLRARRMAAGALTLASPEVRFTLAFGSDDPVDVEMKALHRTNALVEEFMLLANISVAKFIYASFPACALLRSHPPPAPASLEALNRSLVRLGAQLEFGSSKELADSLDRIDIPEDPYLNKLVRMMTTRCMMQAVYFSSGTEAYERYHHYGLAAPIYTHFTSPIRRYADVIVHRLLHSAIDPNFPIDPALLNRTGMDLQCKTLNHRHRMAQLASRSSVELFTHLMFKGRMEYEEAYVIRVLKNAFIALVPKYGLESIIHLIPHPQDGSAEGVTPPVYTYCESDSTLAFPVDGEDVVIAMFMKIRVRLSIRHRLKGGGEGGLRQNLETKLVAPAIPNLSVSSASPARPLPADATNSDVKLKLRRLGADP